MFIIVKLFVVLGLEMVKIMDVKTCSVCSKKISLRNNPGGLVFDDTFFVCEECVSKHKNDDISELGDFSSRSFQKGMPIALWLLHEQNKDKPFMSSVKIK